MGMAGVSAPNDLTFGLSKVLIDKRTTPHNPARSLKNNFTKASHDTGTGLARTGTNTRLSDSREGGEAH